MDVLAHTLWTHAAFYPKYKNQRRQRYLGALFGVLPDLVSFVPMFVFAAFSGSLFDSQWYMRTGGIYAYALRSYDYTHSLVVFVVVFALVMALRRGKPYWPLLGWGLHIVIDIFTHPHFYQTPFLFPLSNYKNSYAVAWSEPWFMAINYGLLLVTYLTIWHWSKRGQRPERQQPTRPMTKQNRS